jgi:LPXTG-site transpeptidase (sortase) family protein
MTSDQGGSDSYWGTITAGTQLVAPPTTTPTRPVTPTPGSGDEPPSSPRRILRTVVIVLVLGVCAAVPWVAPQIPDWFGSKVPKTSVVVRTPDPSPEPPALAKGKEYIPAAGLVGSRLKAAGTPLELVVKRLSVRSPVTPISGQSGELLPPSDPTVLGWWREGPAAGAQEGGVVITGHTVHTGGGAFDHLGRLAPGDKVRVRTAAGWIGYVVVQSQTLSTKQLAHKADEVFQRAGDGHLVLITCSDYNGSIYLSNSVVYAVPVADEPAKAS